MIKRPEDVLALLAWAGFILIAGFAVYAYMKYGVDPNHIYFSI